MADLQTYDIDMKDILSDLQPKMHESLSRFIKNTSLENIKWKVGDLLYSTQSGMLTNIPEGNHPIAICVISSGFIPSSPEARFMSLDDLSLDGVYNIGWGPNNQLVKDMPEKFEIPNWLAINAIANNLFYHKLCNGYHSFVGSDMFDYNEIPYSKVGIAAPSFNALAPYPYVDGKDTINEDYLKERLNNEDFKNVLTILDGEKLTDTLMKNCTNIPDRFPAYTCQHDWFPAAYACRKFKTLGTNQGDWYLPSISELCIMYAKVKELNKILKETRNAYEVDLKGVYWSSNQGVDWSAFFLKMSLGGINFEYKSFAYQVRAFFKLKTNND